jgi:hypothetical protein
MPHWTRQMVMGQNAEQHPADMKVTGVGASQHDLVLVV